MVNRDENPFYFNRVPNLVVNHLPKRNVLRLFCPTIVATFFIGMLLFHDFSPPISGEKAAYNYLIRLLILIPLCATIADFRALRNLQIHKQYTVVQSFGFVMLSIIGLVVVVCASMFVPTFTTVESSDGPFELALLVGGGRSVVRWMLCWLLLHRRIAARCMVLLSLVEILMIWILCCVLNSRSEVILDLPVFARSAILVGSIVLWAYICAIAWWLVDRDYT